MEVVLIFLTAVVNLIVAAINLTAIISSRKKEKDLRSAKRKS